MNEAKLHRNIPLIFFFSSVVSFLVLIPVIVPFFESRGLDMHDIFLLQAIFSGAVLIFEVPSGYLSDLLGRRRTLMLGGVFWGVGYTFFPLSTDIVPLIIGEIFMGFGVSLFSGTDISVIYDSLNATGSKKVPIKIIGRKLYYQQLGETIAGLVGGWLVIVSLNAVAWVQMAVSWLPIIVAYFITEPDRPLMDKRKHRENLVYIYKSVFGHSRLLTLIVLNNIFYGVGTLLAVWLFQKYWEQVGVALLYYGYLWALSNFVVAIVARHAHKLEKYMGSPAILVTLGLLPVFGYFGMAWAPGFWGVACCLCFQVARGINQVVLKDALNRRVTGDLRATANSISGLGVRVLFIVLGPAIGFLVDERGMQTALIALGGVYLLVLLSLMFPLLAQRKNFIRIAVK